MMTKVIIITAIADWDRGEIDGLKGIKINDIKEERLMIYDENILLYGYYALQHQPENQQFLRGKNCMKEKRDDRKRGIKLWMM